MAVPNPRTWEDGEDAASIPMAADLNLDIRDTLRWLLNDTSGSPGFMGYSTTATTVNASTWTAIPINVELEKHGGVTHDIVTLNTRITVPETGWYKGSARTTWNSTAGGVTGRRSHDIRVNGTTFQNVRSDNNPMITDLDFSCPASPFRVWLVAGQYIELMAWQDTANNLHTMWSATEALSPEIGFWYDSVQA